MTEVKHDSKRSMAFVVPPVASKLDKGAQGRVRAYHITEKGDSVVEELDILEEPVQISFQGVPYLHSHKYVAQGSTLDVTYPHIQVYLVQAARIPNPDNNIVIYLWYGNKGIQTQSVECNLSIESMTEKGKSWNIKAKCNINHAGASITDLKFEGVKYSDVTLPLSISGTIVLSK